MVNASRSRIALVTGGALRIGRAICRDLAAHGWSVAIHYNRSSEAAEELAAELREAGGKAVTIGAELGRHDAMMRLMPAVNEALGPVTLLVNNAAMFVRDDIGRVERPLYEEHMAVNLAAPVFLTQGLAEQLPVDTHANVINILDQRVLKPLPVYFSYQLSKSALLTATSTMAQALAPWIRVNGIAPGPTLSHVLQSDSNFDNEVRNVPLHRGAELAEFGRTVRYLIENESITGQVVALDGGQHLAWKTPDHATID